MLEPELRKDADNSVFDKLEAAYRQNKDRLVTFAAAFLGDTGLAEDVVHDVFATLAKRPERFVRIANPDGYLTVCARNEALALLRRRKRLAGVNHVVGESSPADADPARSVSRTEENGVLLTLVAALPPALGQVLSLRVWGELSYREIAEIEGISKGTAYARYVQALEELRRALARGVRDE